MTIAKMFKRTFWTYRYQICLLVIAGFLSAFLEGIGINAVIPLFSFVVKDSGQPTDVISHAIEKVFIFLHIPYTLKYLLLSIGLLFLFKSVAAFASMYITDSLRTKTIRNTREKLLDLTLKADWLYLSKQKIGHLEKILMSEIQSTYVAVFSYSSALLTLAINALAYLVIAFNISPSITLLTVVLGGAFFWGFKPLMDRVRRASHETSLAYKNVANHINESMIGMKTIKAMALEETVVDKGRNFFEKFRYLEMKQNVISILSYVLTQPLSVLVICALFAYSYKSPNFSFASFVVIVYAINKIFTYVQSGQGLVQNIVMQYPYMRDVVEYEDEIVRHVPRRESRDGPVVFRDSIEFKDVSFAYEKGRTVLSNISFNVKKGDMIGIAGPSGGGKTTIVDCLLGLISPHSGAILVDGHDLSGIKDQAWKRRVGYVSQDIFLMNDTIRNNITFYDPGISEAEVIEAAKKAHIYEMVQKKPQGLDTPVGERGMELSGGQRQRVALARVLARKADILILDEATSALDNESEAAIQKAIEELHGRITTIIIAHRPTTVARVDKLIVVKDGRISEEGGPDQLLADTNSYFHKMYYAKHS